jgi:hypothetical protein
MDIALTSQLGDPGSNPNSAKNSLSEKWLYWGPYNTSSEIHHSFGSMHFHLSMVMYKHTWTEAWYLSKCCNPAIGKVDEMVEPEMSQVNLDYY